MINFPYLKAELLRRRTKTILIAIGLAVPIALTIVVGAYSTGLSNAQDEVLEPLVGLGTDMTVTKTADAGTQNRGGPPRFGLADRKAGESFSEDNFTTGANATFNAGTVDEIDGLSDVGSTASALTVVNLMVSGTVPDTASGNTGPGAGGAAGGGRGGPDSIDVESRTITGIAADTQLGPISDDQLQEGQLLSAVDEQQAVVTSGYAETNDLKIGDSLTLKDEKFEVVGIVSNPLAGNSSDIYVQLGQLQDLADLEDKVNTVYVRATSQEAVDAVSSEIEGTIDGATITTNASLAGQVSGSLVDANNLVNKMGVFLQLTLLLAAIVITAILTLNAVNKRTREFGTLKSIGWGNKRLVRQVIAESLSTGMIGAAAGVLLGLIAMAGAKLDPLSMSVSGQSAQTARPGAGLVGGPGGPGGPGGAGGGPPGFARQAAEAASETISIIPALSINTILIAAAIGATTALVAGGLGSLKTSRLSPVEALKHVD
ncbi:MAG: ABC transporter permease [Solirubrobacterales bacterium]